jgi:hypothetical protein
MFLGGNELKALGIEPKGGNELNDRARGIGRNHRSNISIIKIIKPLIAISITIMVLSS